MPGFEFLALGGLLTGLVFGLWNHVKAFAWRLANCVIVEADLDSSSSMRLHERIWRGEFQPARFRALYFCRASAWSNQTRTAKHFPVEVLPVSARLLVWKGWRPVWIYRRTDLCLVVTTLRIFFDVEKEFLVSAEPETYAFSFCVVRRFGHRNPRLSRSVSVGGESNRPPSGDAPSVHDVGLGGLSYRQARPIGVSHEEFERSNHMIVDDQALTADKQAIVDECVHWSKMQTWYSDRGVPWRRGYLFSGSPGTGKTSLAKAIAQKLGATLNVFDLATYDDDSFMSDWSVVANAGSQPVVVLFEDFDRVFSGDANVTTTDLSPGLSYQTLLNAISGAVEVSGVILIVTVNNEERLDAAMLRPGRIDRRLRFEPLTEECRRKICRRILRDWPDLAEKTTLETAGKTGAEVQNRCEEIAFVKAWENPTELDAMITAACDAIARRPKSELIPQA
jgi:hypothetical protein